MWSTICSTIHKFLLETGKKPRKIITNSYIRGKNLKQFPVWRSLWLITMAMLAMGCDMNACQKAVSSKRKDLFTPWNRVLLEKLIVSQPVKKFPAFYGTRRFIIAFTSAPHLSLSWVWSIQSSSPHPTYWRSTLMLFSHLTLGLPSGLFPSGFPPKPCINHSKPLQK